ncbi:hypothetical protein E2542_SST27815 [Spatholobus suberectus]|nr:hypothetical protein E2542_SST27815 [Spatholobus suberectus]
MSSSVGLLPLANPDDAPPPRKVRSVLPFFGFVNMTISSVVTVYRAHGSHDTPMIAFVAFVYFGSFLLDYCFRLYHALPPSPRRRNVKIGIWALISGIMFGFACEFSTFMSLVESLSFFGLVLCGNTFLFYVYFIWEGDKSASSTACSTPHHDDDDACCNYKPLTEAKIVDGV